MPNFAPQQHSDGSCAGYTVQNGDYCAQIAAANSITVDQLNNYNTKTWGWNGCGSNLWIGTNICLSPGSPPMPAPVANAVCGPQVPYTPQPPSGTDLASLNPCPLNSCCDIWGQCGTTAEFCTVSQSQTGNPGTAAPGANGCISNCGTNLVLSGPPATFKNFGWFEGYNFGRNCLYQDALQIDTSKYTHLVYAFGTLDSNFNVQIGDTLATRQFDRFLNIPNVKKIFSIGGWSFSTDASTYMIFRQGVTSDNRLKMALNIANFVKAHNLDGINMDWEYPGEPDMKWIPVASKDDGENYFRFIQMLRYLLPDKEISVAAPASYWYLKGMPIAKIAQFTDYVIYMTYDLHGQWDAFNRWSQDDCQDGNCLRSGVNFTETVEALKMITKAGVPSNQVIVGVTSYGRSFGMADGNCWGQDCRFTGTSDDSHATKGRCTDTGGYIANAEIKEIIASGNRVNQNFLDGGSFTNILVYDNNQWVSWMDDSNKGWRTKIYQNLNFGGVTDWATDLQTFNTPPANAVNSTWEGYKFQQKASAHIGSYGAKPTGNWTSINCAAPEVANAKAYTGPQIWAQLDCNNAWFDALTQWIITDSKADNPKISFSNSVSGYLFSGTAPSADCGTTLDAGCSGLSCFDSDGYGGAAGYYVWNSLVSVNQMFKNFRTVLMQQAGTMITPAFDAFEKDFAPVRKVDNDMFMVLLTLLTFGISASIGPFFRGAISELRWFRTADGKDINPNTLSTLQELTDNIVSTSISIAKTLAAPKQAGSWQPKDQDNLNMFFGQVLNEWGTVVDNTVASLFSGSFDTMGKLTQMISDGKMIRANATSPSATAAIGKGISKTFFAFAIPAAWRSAGRHPVVIDTGNDCNAKAPTADLTDDAISRGGVCYNNRMYYLVEPKGDAVTCSSTGKVRRGDGHSATTCRNNQFSALPGLSALNGNNYGGVTVQDLVIGSVKTYQSNGNKNGAALADPASTDVMSALSQADLTTAGVIRLPICSADYARTAWADTTRYDVTDPTYPCSPRYGIAHCWDITYKGATTSGSPSISDCQTIVKNVAGDGDWTTGIGDPEHNIVSYGNCALGVKGNGAQGSVVFHVGNQDVINIINTAVSQYGWNGLVGAEGTMTCHGNSNSAAPQQVTWGLYQNT